MKVTAIILGWPPRAWGWAYFGLVPLYALAYTYIPAATLDYGEHCPGFISSFYFSGVTVTTLGYGDIKPIGSLSQILTASEAIFGIMFIGLFLNSLSHRRDLDARKQDQEMVRDIVDSKVGDLIGSPYMFAMYEAANVESDDKFSDEHIAKIFGRTNPNAESTIGSYGGRKLTWLEAMCSSRKQNKETINDLLVLVRFLDADLVRILSDIENCTFYKVLDGVIAGLPFGNRHFAALTKDYCLYNSHIKELLQYRESSLSAVRST